MVNAVNSGRGAAEYSQSTTVRYGRVTITQLARMACIPSRFIQDSLNRVTNYKLGDLTSTGQGRGRRLTFSSSPSSLDEVVKACGHQLQLHENELTVFDLAKMLGEDPLFFLEYYIDQERLPNRFICRQVSVDDKVPAAPLFKREDVNDIATFIGRPPLTAGRFETILTKLDGLCQSQPFAHLGQQVAIMKIQVALLTRYAVDRTTETPLQTSDQFLAACKDTATYLTTLQISFIRALGIPEEWAFKSEVNIPSFFQSQQPINLTEISTALDKVKKDIRATELHRLLAAYSMQMGDAGSLSVIHYLLEEVERQPASNIPGLIERYDFLSSLLPLRFFSILPHSFETVTSFEAALPPIAPSAPATGQRTERSAEEKKNIDKLVSLGTVRFLLVPWEEGGYETKGYGDYIQSLSTRKPRGLASRLSEYHPAVFVRLITEVARQRCKDINQLTINDFRKASLEKPFVADLRSTIALLLAAADMDPYDPNIAGKELCVRLQRFADKFPPLPEE